MEGVIFDAVLVLDVGFEALDMSRCTGFDTHGCIAVPLPSYVAAPGSPEGEILVPQLRLQTVHDCIVLTAVIGLPA